jgi:hypothetical protein
MLFVNMVCLIVGLACSFGSMTLTYIFVSITIENENPTIYVSIVRNFPCQTLKISKVSLVVMGS